MLSENEAQLWSFELIERHIDRGNSYCLSNDNALTLLRPADIVETMDHHFFGHTTTTTSLRHGH